MCIHSRSLAPARPGAVRRLRPSGLRSKARRRRVCVQRHSRVCCALDLRPLLGFRPLCATSARANAIPRRVTRHDAIHATHTHTHTHTCGTRPKHAIPPFAYPPPSPSTRARNRTDSRCPRLEIWVLVTACRHPRPQMYALASPGVETWGPPPPMHRHLIVYVQ